MSIYSKLTLLPKGCFNEFWAVWGWHSDDEQLEVFSFVVEQQLSLLLFDEQHPDSFGALEALVLLISVTFLATTSEFRTVYF